MPAVISARPNTWTQSSTGDATSTNCTNTPNRTAEIISKIHSWCVKIPVIPPTRSRHSIAAIASNISLVSVVIGGINIAKKNTKYPPSIIIKVWLVHLLLSRRSAATEVSTRLNTRSHVGRLPEPMISRNRRNEDDETSANPRTPR